MSYLSGQSPTSRLTKQLLHARAVCHVTRRVAVVEFRKVAVQVGATDVMMRTVKRPLQLRKVVLCFVGPTRLFSDVLASSVVDRVVSSHQLSDFLVGRPLVGVKLRSRHVSVLGDGSAQFSDARVLKNLGTNSGSFTINERENQSPASIATQPACTRIVGVAILGAATDVGLVGNDDIGSEQRAVGAKAHCFAKAVAKRPRRVRVQLVFPLDLASRNAVLGTSKLKGDEQPSANGNLASVHDGSRKHAELLAALRALPETPLSQLAGRSFPPHSVARLQEIVPFSASAMGANRLPVPAHFLKKFVGSGLGRNPVRQGRKADFHGPIVANGCISAPEMGKYNCVTYPEWRFAMANSPHPVNFADAVDEIVDGIRKLIKVAARCITRRDALNVGIDDSEVSGNVWGDTPGNVWGHASDRRTDAA